MTLLAQWLRQLAGMQCYALGPESEPKPKQLFAFVFYVHTD